MKKDKSLIFINRVPTEVFLKINQQPGITQIEIAEELNITAAYSGQIVIKLRKAGLVNRKRRNKVIYLALSERGEELARNLNQFYTFLSQLYLQPSGHTGSNPICEEVRL